MLASGRESRMPSISPLITLPTTLPRACGGASDAAAGTSICTALALTPTAKDAQRNSAALGAAAATARHTTWADSVPAIKARFGQRSTSGTSNTRPTA
jgi:hypothetical protein